jgi:PiT family inorganic phosphate transporter
MGSNDVANAAGPVVGAKLLSPATAGTLGGVGLALGVLTYGRPLLSRVAFEIVHVDRTMATAAQAVQGGVVLATVAFGLFTSMNQALVGAMAGTGVARGKQTVDLATLAAILRGWLLGPAAGLAVAFLVAQLLLAVGAHVR